MKSLEPSQKTPPMTEEMGALGNLWKMVWKGRKRLDQITEGCMYLSKSLSFLLESWKQRWLIYSFKKITVVSVENKFLQGSNQDYFQKIRLSLVQT